MLTGMHFKKQTIMKDDNFIPFPRTIGEIFRQMTGDGASAHPFIQFFKYGIVGGLSTFVDMFVFFLSAWFLFPALTENDIFVKLFNMIGVAVRVATIESDVRANMQLINNLIAFVVSNCFCYVLNRIFVFKPGRHSQLKEFLLFIAASGISSGIGILISDVLVRWFGMQTSISYIIKITASIMINYVARKKIVFEG